MFVPLYDCVCVCVRACVRACVRECVSACVRACVRAWVSACVSACVRACVRAGGRACVRAGVRILRVSHVIMCVSMCVWAFARVYTCACARVWVCVSMCVCIMCTHMYTYVYTHNRSKPHTLSLQFSFQGRVKCPIGRWPEHATCYASCSPTVTTYVCATTRRTGEWLSSQPGTPLRVSPSTASYRQSSIWRRRDLAPQWRHRCRRRGKRTSCVAGTTGVETTYWCG